MFAVTTRTLPIFLGTSGKETLLLPNSSMQTVRITGITGSHVIRNMTIVGPTGMRWWLDITPAYTVRVHVAIGDCDVVLIYMVIV